MPGSKLLLSFAIAIGAVTLLFWWGGVDFGDVMGALRAVDPKLFVLLLLVQAAIHLFRGLRLRGMIAAMGEQPPPVLGLVGSSAAWILDSQILPGRIGEASLVLHLGRIGVTAEHGVVGLLLSRLLDLFMLVATLAGACLVVGLAGARPEIEFLVPLGFAALGLAVVLGASIFQGGTLVGWGRGLLRRMGLERFRLGAKLLSFSGRVESALHSVPRAALGRAAVWSVLVCGAIIAAYVVLGTAVGLSGLSTFDFIFGSCFAILGSLLPISGFLGIGAFDMAWAFGFAAVGVPEEQAVATGLAFHALYVVSIAIHGAWGHAVVPRAKRKAEPGA